LNGGHVVGDGAETVAGKDLRSGGFGGGFDAGGLAKIISVDFRNIPCA
jgi:hypothetical protein